MQSTRVRDDVAVEVRSYLPRRRMTQVALAQKLGVSKNWLDRRLRAEVPMTVEDLVQIADALDADPAKVLADALALTAVSS